MAGKSSHYRGREVIEKLNTYMYDLCCGKRRLPGICRQQRPWPDCADQCSLIRAFAVRLQNHKTLLTTSMNNKGPYQIMWLHRLIFAYAPKAPFLLTWFIYDDDLLFSVPFNINLYWADEMAIIKDSVQWSAIQWRVEFCLQLDSNPGPQDPKSGVLTTHPSATWMLRGSCTVNSCYLAVEGTL